MASSTAINKQKEILASLKSKDNKIALNAIDNLKKQGKLEILPEVIKIYVETKNQAVKEGLLGVFFQLKIPASVDYLIDAVKNENYKEHHHIFLQAIWESGLDASNHLKSLIDFAINGTYMVCLESLTIIENIEEGLSEQDITDAIAEINERLQWQKSDNDTLLASIVVVLQNMIID